MYFNITKLILVKHALWYTYAHISVVKKYIVAIEKNRDYILMSIIISAM